jgi:hypothetical protein
MKYEAPKIEVVVSAVKSIQGNSKGKSEQLDMAFAPTIGAYEADE